jgi:hypothetical protein
MFSIGIVSDQFQKLITGHGVLVDGQLSDVSANGKEQPQVEGVLIALH